MRDPKAILVTGASGLIGGAVLQRLLAEIPGMHVYALVRDLSRWRAEAMALGVPVTRVTPVVGDLTKPGLGLRRDVRRALERRVAVIFHAAADTVFSRPLDEARPVNTVGTSRIVRLAESCEELQRLVYVSTAFVAGRRTGLVLEKDNGPQAGFLNGYEQSKYEAESLVRSSGLPWVIARPSTVVCDDLGGHVSQFNAIHRSLRLCHNGLASMMPGQPENPIDVVSTQYVADGCTALVTHPGIEGETFHLCAGERAVPMGEAIDLAYDIWAEDPAWRRRGVARPVITDLDTYRMFEQGVEDTGDPRLVAITRSFSHFVPQLALPKQFDISRTLAVVGMAPDPSVRLWAAAVRHLVASRWAPNARRAA